MNGMLYGNLLKKIIKVKPFLAKLNS